MQQERPEVRLRRIAGGVMWWLLPLTIESVAAAVGPDGCSSCVGTCCTVPISDMYTEDLSIGGKGACRPEFGDVEMELTANVPINYR